jgi:hypothetical protein
MEEQIQDIGFWNIVYDNFYFFGFLVLAGIGVLVLFLLRGGKIKLGDNEFMMGGKKVSLETLMDIRDQKKDAEFRAHREIVADQKEHIQIRLPKLKNLLTCCTDNSKPHLIKTITLEWVFILHSIAERNAIEDKFDGDVLKSDYAKAKVDQFLEVYKESQQLEWSGLPSSDIIKDGLEEIFRDIMTELREITRGKKAELKEVLEGYDRISKGLEGNKGGE